MFTYDVVVVSQVKPRSAFLVRRGINERNGVSDGNGATPHPPAVFVS
ncbi:TPA: hypothetical protein R4B84_000997 [Salmonella enterica subsp. enterica serovar Stanley]|nr:hypothetical protein [Citrobacter freundii]EKO4895358.1 hypothetical protein [Salmonella enterica]HAK8685583.1 hypothetical protein [Salmonella enterica]HEC8290733.1 hypothetical protein [Salmonella enterica subsp. enterica serovar Stanley]